MFPRQLAGAVAILVATATMALGQSNDVKGWAPKPPAGGGAVAPMPPPPPPGNGPKTIGRGGGVAAPQPPKAPPGPAMGGGGGTIVGIEASDPAAIADAMQRAGYRAELGTDDEGDPRIIGSASRSTYWIRFLDCTQNTDCLGIEFYLSYSGIDPMPTLEAINGFNNDYRYVRAAIDQWGQPTLYMDVLMRDGGITKDALLEYLRLWYLIVPSYEELIGF